MEIKTAAAYIRVSTEEQAEYSPASQLSKIREYAKRNGFFVPEEFVFADEGISGKTTKKRTEFNKMIAVAKTKPKPFDTILVWKFSRFARNREDSIVYKSMLRRELGIRVISVSEDIGDDKMSVLFESMIEAMDEYYSVNLAEEVKRGMVERIKKGGACATAPFGYMMINKELKICEKEADIIKWVFNAYVNGESAVGIARRLNDMGIYTHRGGRIENRTVEYWLNNPVYIGKIRWNPNGKTLRYHWNDCGVIISDGEHKAIIENELWDKVQKKIEKGKGNKRTGYECKSLSSWMVGIFRCGLCNGAMVNCGGYFYCGNKIKGTCNGNGGIRVDLIEKEILNLIEGLSGTIDVSFVPVKKRKISGNRLENMQLKLMRVKAAYENGIDSLEEYKKNKERIKQQIDEIKNELPDDNTYIPTELCIMDILKSENVNNAEKNKIVRYVIDRVVKVGREEYNIFLNFRCLEDLTEN